MADASPLKPFYSVLVLAFVCSALVAGAVVGLQPLQEANRQLDRKKNILSAAGLYREDHADRSPLRRHRDPHHRLRPAAMSRRTGLPPSPTISSRPRSAPSWAAASMPPQIWPASAAWKNIPSSIW